jgi:hypothetical protein
MDRANVLYETLLMCRRLHRLADLKFCHGGG